MFGVYDRRQDKFLAYHEEKRVCQKFKLQYELSTESDLSIIKIRKSDLPNDYEEDYLVRYGNSFVQFKYLEVCQYDMGPILEDLYQAHDTLMLLVEAKNKKKLIKKLLEADEVILNEISEISSGGYSSEYLESRRRDLEEYKLMLEEGKWDH